MTSTTNAVPNPGSNEARARGCTCPVIDNHHGRGVPLPGGNKFWITGNCPVHDPGSITTNTTSPDWEAHRRMADHFSRTHLARGR